MRVYQFAIALQLLLLVPVETAAQPAAPAAVSGVGVEERVGSRLPLDAAFTTSKGQKVKLGELLVASDSTLLVLAYNRCQMLCNLVLRGVARLLKEAEWAENRQFRVLTISIDPSESPHEAARTQQAVLDQTGASGQVQLWPFLVGDRRSIDEVANALGFRYRWDARTEQYAHPAVIFAISPEGEILRYFHGVSFDQKQVLAGFAGEDSGGAAFAAAAVLNCFRFDAVGRKYGPLIQLSFQIGAGAVLLCLMIGVAVLARKGQASP